MAHLRLDLRHRAPRRSRPSRGSWPPRPPGISPRSARTSQTLRAPHRASGGNALRRSTARHLGAGVALDHRLIPPSSGCQSQVYPTCTSTYASIVHDGNPDQRPSRCGRGGRPCPGAASPASLRLASRLSSDSIRSPTDADGRDHGQTSAREAISGTPEQPWPRAPARRRRRRPCSHQPEASRGSRRGRRRSAPSTVLPGLMRGASLRLPVGPAREVGAGVAEHHHRHDGEEHEERCRHVRVEATERGRRRPPSDVTTTESNSRSTTAWDEQPAHVEDAEEGAGDAGQGLADLGLAELGDHHAEQRGRHEQEVAWYSLAQVGDDGSAAPPVMPKLTQRLRALGLDQLRRTRAGRSG